MAVGTDTHSGVDVEDLNSRKSVIEEKPLNRWVRTS
jgi:hypothetical protein